MNNHNLKKDSIALHGTNSHSDSICELNKINFSFKPTTSFAEFYQMIRTLNTRLSTYEIKIIYKFLDGKTIGDFSNTRWNNFYQLFMSPFLACDKDDDCLLNKEELDECLGNEDMSIIKEYESKGYREAELIDEIIFSLDYMKHGGLTFADYLILKRIVIGYRQYQDNGKLDKKAFFSAIRTTFMNNLIDEMDAEIIFRLGINLMYDPTVEEEQIDLMQYFEICRLVNSYFNYGVTIGEGFLTRDILTKRFESSRYPSKMTPIMYDAFFNLFSEDINLKTKYDSTKLDPNTIKFEDYITIEFWANIFLKYANTTRDITFPSIDKQGFKSLVKTDRHFRKNYWKYIAYSNFEDYSDIDKVVLPATNITDFDFLTNFQINFIQTGTGMKKKEKTDMKTSVFDTLQLQTKSKSLFDLQIDDDTDDEAENADNQQENPYDSPDFQDLLSKSMKYYFTILDLNINNYLTFEEFIVFIKYLNVYDKLNKHNKDKRGILSTSSVNSIYAFNP